MLIKTLWLMQCPGCWSYGTFALPLNGWVECDCGEKMSAVDLRLADQNASKRR